LGIHEKGPEYATFVDQWHRGLNLTAATDGGLKENIESHGYILYQGKKYSEDDFPDLDIK